MTQSNSRRRAVLFDMDGVLIDSEPIWRRAEIEVFAGVGLPITERECLQTQGLRIDDAVKYWFVRSPWPGPPCEAVAKAIVERVAELIRSDGRLLPGVHEAIDAARQRGWRLGLASSSSQFLIDTVLDHFELASAFEATRSAETELFGKPHPAVYLSTATDLSIDPRHCIAIEDSVNGVVSALAAQMRCIAIPALAEREDPRFRVATLQLASLESLAKALDDLETS